MRRTSSSSAMARWPPATRKTGAPTPSTPRSTSAAKASGSVDLGEKEKWWRREDSNLRHGAYETPALPPELRRRAGGPSRKVTGLGSRSQANRGSFLSGCARNCAREAPRDVLKVPRAHDVVAVEDRASLVPSHRHRNSLWHPCVDHVSHRRSPAV